MDAMQFMRRLGNMFYMINPSDLDGIGDYEFDKVPKYIHMAVPFFLLFIFVEEIYGRVTGKTIYAVRDTICSISLGLVQQILGIWINHIALVPYIWIFRHYRLIGHFPRGYLLFFTAFLGCDFGYYVFHRVSHNWHWMWAAHSVHHSGERYNFATALRQGAFQPYISWMFYLPLALLGVPPAVFAAHSQLNTVYQFWIHTEIVDKLPWPLEGFLNTPSHHRMHHQPPGNCNYAGVLIIWDRLFNTFKDEEDSKVVGIYGLAKPANTFDPVKLNLLHATRLLSVDGSETATTSGSNGSKDAGKISLSNIRLLFTRRCSHSWHPRIVDTLVGLVRLYPWTTKRRVQIPIRDDCIATETRKSLNSREIEFFEGRNEREGKAFFSGSIIVAIFSLLWWLFSFVGGYAMMDNVKGIQSAFCANYSGANAVSAYMCSPDRIEWIDCHWILLASLCCVLTVMVSGFSLMQRRLDFNSTARDAKMK
jgi:sterol desaturase/sphingolipid hydroxylase (fatty acid hydroxylase superfamily)